MTLSGYFVSLTVHWTDISWMEMVEKKHSSNVRPRQKHRELHLRSIHLSVSDVS